MNEHQTELKAALDVLRESITAKRPLNRYHARAILLPLGACLRAAPNNGDNAGARAVPADELRWVKTATQAHTPAWRAAVDDEMEMAVTELVHSADPRFLGRKDFDWRYADTARALLDDRLRALAALEFELDPTLARALADTDRRLAAARPAQRRPG